MPGKKYEVFVQKGRPWWKIVTGILFSNLGELGFDTFDYLQLMF